MIQQNINQAISLASLLATQNPQFKQMAEKRQLIEQTETQQKLGNQLNEILSDPEAPEKTFEHAAEVSDILAGEEFATNKRLAELAKTPEEMEKYLGRMLPNVPSERHLAEEVKDIRREAANEERQRRMAEKQKKEAELMKAQQEREAADEKIRIEQEQRRETRRRILEGTPYQYKEVE